MSTMFYKQSFKPRASPSTPGLNVRHLQYIATRPGAVYNQGCGFGLWGQLPGDRNVHIQTDLEQAKRIIRQVSNNHTLYRAIFSVGKKDAQEHGLYSRDRWEQLVNDHIRYIAKEMNIRPEYMCWCASFHYAKGHPHVHLLYWDNSDEPRQEFIPKSQWDAKAEHIRAAFAGDIHREEIREAQKKQREQIEPLRTAIQAMCREANPEKALDLPRLYKSASLEGLSKQLFELIRNMPAKGSLRYAYLPPDYKVKVDALVEECLKVTELRKELERYDTCTRQISLLYANGKAGGAANMEKARDKLHKELGNQVMDAIREVKAELQQSGPENQEAAHALIREAVQEIVPSLDSYHALKVMLPKDRIPVSCMADQIPGYRDQLNRVVGDVMMDARVRLRLQAYALDTAGIDLTAKPDAPKFSRKPQDARSTMDSIAFPEDKPKEHIFQGKVLTEEEWAAYQDVYREVKQKLRSEITAQVRLDAGWTEEAMRTGTAFLLMSMMHLVSQAANQRQAGAAQARNNWKTRSKDKSHEAKRDYWKTQENASEWGEYD